MNHIHITRLTDIEYVTIKNYFCKTILCYYKNMFNVIYKYQYDILNIFVYLYYNINM